MDNEGNVEGIPVWDQVRFFTTWAPLLGFGQRFLGEPDAYKRTVIVSDAVEWIASQTKATVDDKFVRLIAAVLKTPEGEALVRGLVSLGQSVIAAGENVK